MLEDNETKTLCHVWELMNKIAARDGSPTGICPDWFSELKDRLKDVVESNCSLQRDVWLHPFLYKTYEQLNKEPSEGR